MRFFHAIHAAGRAATDENFPEETASLLVLKAVDCKNLLAVHIGQTKDCLDGVEPFAELALIKQHHHVRIVDNRLFYDFAADNILYLLRYHTDTCPELTGCLIHKLDVLRHERTGDRCLRYPYRTVFDDFAALKLAAPCGQKLRHGHKNYSADVRTAQRQTTAARGAKWGRAWRKWEKGQIGSKWM